MTQQLLVEQEFIQNVAAEAMTRGHECFKSRQWDEAVHEFRKAVEINPCSAEARYWLAHAYSVSDPDFSVRRERSVDAAIDEYRNSIGLDPNFGPSHARLANHYHVHKGMIDEAITVYEKALKVGGLDPTDEFVVYNNLGFIYRDKQMYEKALQCFTKAASREPGASYMLWKIATMYAVQGKASEAVEFLQRAIELGENPKRIYRSNGWFDNIKHTKEFEDFIQTIE